MKPVDENGVVRQDILDEPYIPKEPSKAEKIQVELEGKLAEQRLIKKDISELQKYLAENKVKRKQALSTPTGEGKVIPKELEPLAVEARKYKSASEFVKGIKQNYSFVDEFGGRTNIEISGNSAKICGMYAEGKGTKLYERVIDAYAEVRDYAVLDRGVQGV